MKKKKSFKKPNFLKRNSGGDKTAKKSRPGSINLSSTQMEALKNTSNEFGSSKRRRSFNFKNVSIFSNRSFTFRGLTEREKELYIKNFPERKKNHIVGISLLTKSLTEMKSKKIIFDCEINNATGNTSSSSTTGKTVDLKKRKKFISASEKKAKALKIIGNNITATSLRINERLLAQQSIITVFSELQKKYLYYFEDLNNIVDFMSEEQLINQSTIEFITGNIMDIIKQNKDTATKYNKIVDSKANRGSIESKMLALMKTEYAELDEVTESIIDSASVELGRDVSLSSTQDNKATDKLSDKKNNNRRSTVNHSSMTEQNSQKLKNMIEKEIINTEKERVLQNVNIIDVNTIDATATAGDDSVSKKDHRVSNEILSEKEKKKMLMEINTYENSGSINQVVEKKRTKKE